MQLETKMVQIDKLTAYENNAKIHTKKQIEHIANSIRDFGFNDPVGVWTREDGVIEIVTGHGAVQAAASLGMTEVPCNFLDHLTDEERREYCHIHNQTQLETGFDTEALIADMDNLDCDWENYGFEAYCYDEGEAEEVDVPDVVECRCKPGEIWQLGSHKIMCGSATDAEDMQQLCGGGVVADLLVTDPPYGISYTGKTKDALTIENDSLEDAELQAFLHDAFSQAIEHMSPGAAFYIFHADSKGDVFRSACSSAGLKIRECLVWVKNVMTLGRQDYQWRHEPCLYGWKDGASHSWYSDRKQTTVLEFDKPTANREHPTMKPVPLIAYLIGNSSKEGDVVLDCFGGSGSTLIACEQLGRKCLTMELDPHYCDVIITRWEELTGKKAVLIDQEM